MSLPDRMGAVPTFVPGPSARPRLAAAAVVGAGLALAVAGGALLALGSRNAPAPPASIASALPGRSPLPAFALVSHRGTPFTDAALRGRWTFLFFGYTHCPNVCPTTLAALAEVMRRSGENPELPRPQVVFVSLDAERDTPSLMAEYVTAFDASFIGATGTDAELAPLLESLGIFYERHGGMRGNDLIDHTADVFLIDPSVRPRAVFPHPPRPEAIVAAYQQLAAAAQNLK